MREHPRIQAYGLGARERAPLELTLRRTDGSFLDLGDQRGRVVLLFVFATFDGVSQMQLRPLEEIAAQFPEVTIIGVAAQQDARTLLDAYEHALSPQMVLTYDPEGSVRSGRSALGPITAVPTTLVLDAEGNERSRYTGFQDRATLEPRLLAAGASSGPNEP